VTGLPALLGRIPDDYKPLASLAIGAFILVCLVMFHGGGMHSIFVQYQRGEKRLRQGRPHKAAASALFGWSIFLMLAMHVAEISVWAFSLTELGLIQRPRDALYFCANAYTTLGFGNIDLDKSWRNLSPIIGISGLFTFAWTTSALVDIVARRNRLVEQLDLEREEEKHLRTQLRKDEGAALIREQDAEHAAKAKAHADAAGAAFLEHYRIWREEEKKLTELRKAGATEIREFRAKERSEEDNLGKKYSPPGSPDMK